MITSMIVAFCTFELQKRLWRPLQSIVTIINELLSILFSQPRSQQSIINSECDDHGIKSIKLERHDSPLTLLLRERRNVSFSTTEVRTYETILGDNPSCSQGVPLTIGWHHVPHLTETRTVDAFEKDPFRISRPLASRTVYETVLLTEPRDREKILLSLGYSKDEIADAERQCLEAKKERRETIEHYFKVARRKAVRHKADPRSWIARWHLRHDVHHHSHFNNTAA